jgi:hypothetical protein
MLSKTSTGRQKHPKWIHEYDNWWRKMKKMSNKIGLFGRIQQKLTKTAKKKTIYNNIISTLFIDYISRKRRGLDADHPKQSNEANIEMSPANSR